MNDDDIIGTHLIKKGEEIAEFFNVNANIINSVINIYPMLINPYYFSLIKKKGDPIWRQCVPDIKELMDDLPEDPLQEEKYSPVKSIIHRYSNRVVFLVTNKCATFCRFCTRKRRFNTSIDDRDIKKGIQYIRRRKKIKEVLVSGGDPLMLPDHKLKEILAQLEKISHLKVIRIATRIPVTYPMRIKKELVEILKINKPTYIVTHFNHPRELTISSRNAIKLLIENGFPVLNQTVLLKGINDNFTTLKRLFEALVEVKVRPYYLFFIDLVKGTTHFRVDLNKGLMIYQQLIERLSGIAVPKLMIDLPDGGGKVQLSPDIIVNKNGENYILRNYSGKLYIYPR